MARQLIPLEQAFWARVDKRGPDECWPWKGARNARGYGRLNHRPASQVAWELANGAPFPAGKHGCHACDNPPCVNPAHIFPGTQHQNIADREAKGRGNRDGLKMGPRSLTRCPHDRIPGRRCMECKRAYDAANRDRKREYDRARYTRLHTAI